ncbi:MAG: pyridoxal-phosphate dependent enzyme [Saprospiraceae bacterium]|nr:pyridoxal-phosphate dependent enzyme [Saprospiraceae bacterium]MDP4812766.1 pyridoxal-phosphate dependent enzyme [Saprospiraceae bacterium]
MKYCETILETIGNTPLVQIKKIIPGIKATVLIKVETFNPGNSIKDRMALKMLLDAEANGNLKPGGTIIECTSGNTGMGLAIAAAVRGYKCIFTTTDKQSKEKIDLLKALGADVIVCPTNVHPDDPGSYYSVAKRISTEIPNSFWFNQYDNLSNRQAHYESTGPEIWEQTDGKVTHIITGVGTGGTISGTARFLKEQNKNIKVWGIDTYGSVFKKYHETGIFDEQEIYPYITEGIGEDILPKNVDFSLIDHFEKVSDKDGALMARKIAREEGMLLGYSAGSAVAGLWQMRAELKEEDVVVVIIHDHGSRYVGKIYNDDWMRERGFLESELRAKDILAKKLKKEFISIIPDIAIQEVLRLMRDFDISQLPVMENEEWIGSVGEQQVISALSENRLQNLSVRDIMAPALPVVSEDITVSQLSKIISRQTPAVIVKKTAGDFQIISQYDLIQSL